MNKKKFFTLNEAKKYLLKKGSIILNFDKKNLY